MLVSRRLKNTRKPTTYQGCEERKSDDDEVMKHDRGDHADAGKNHEMASRQPPREPPVSRGVQFLLSPVDHLERK